MRLVKVVVKLVSHSFVDIDGVIKSLVSELNASDASPAVAYMPVERYIIQNKRSNFAYGDSMRTLKHETRKAYISFVCSDVKFTSLKNQMNRIQIPSTVNIDVKLSNVNQTQPKVNLFKSDKSSANKTSK